MTFSLSCRTQISKETITIYSRSFTELQKFLILSNKIPSKNFFSQNVRFFCCSCRVSCVHRCLRGIVIKQFFIFTLNFSPQIISSCLTRSEMKYLDTKISLRKFLLDPFLRWLFFTHCRHLTTVEWSISATFNFDCVVSLCKTTYKSSHSNMYGLPLRWLSSKSNSPFLNFANHLQYVLLPTESYP